MQDLRQLKLPLFILFSLQLSRQICSCRRTNPSFVPDKLLSVTRTLRRRFPSINCQQASLSSKATDKKTGPISWKSLVAFAAVGGAVLYYVKSLKEEKERRKFSFEFENWLIINYRKFKKCYIYIIYIQASQ